MGTRISDRCCSRRRSGGFLGWLGLGAVGLASFLWWQSDRRRKETPASAGPDPRPVPEPAAESPPADPGSISWIPGPAGSVRVFERHADAELTLIFVHGLGGRLEQWSDLVSGLGPKIRTIAFDLPGHGDSDPLPPSQVSIPALADTVGAVADGLALRRAALVGHSLGGPIALDYADRHPERVTGLLLVDPSGDQTYLSREERESFLAPLRRDPRPEIEWYFRQILAGSRPPVADRVLRALETTPADTLVASLEAAAGYSPLPALDRWEKPIRTVVSDLNCLSYSLHCLRPDLKTVPMHGTGHWLMMEEPEAVREAVWDFLEEVVAHQKRYEAARVS